jgi:hypothetical protein
MQSHVDTLTVTPWAFYTVSDAALVTLEAGRREVHALMRSLSTKVAKHRARRARSALRHLLWEQPRKGHAALFRSLQPERRELRAVRLADGSLSAAPDQVRQRVHDFFHSLLGQTHQCADEMPWETGMDPLLLEARGAPGVPLASKFTRGVYDRARCSLATVKVPGPDGIPNEALQLLPAAAHTDIFALFLRFWHEGTPADLKCSITVLLYNKGDATTGPPAYSTPSYTAVALD